MRFTRVTRRSNWRRLDSDDEVFTPGRKKVTHHFIDLVVVVAAVSPLTNLICLFLHYVFCRFPKAPRKSAKPNSFWRKQRPSSRTWWKPRLLRGGPHVRGAAWRRYPGPTVPQSLQSLPSSSSLSSSVDTITSWRRQGCLERAYGLSLLHTCHVPAVTDSGLSAAGTRENCHIRHEITYMLLSHWLI